MDIWRKNAQKRLGNEFTLEDIKGAAATLLIAGNDTVSEDLIQSLPTS